MKRIHLFEFEDQSWFPNWLRMLMTRYIVAIHKLLGSAEELADLLAKTLPYSESPKIIDMCSGGGGPMPEVVQILKEKHGVTDLSLNLSDLYPNTDVAAEINSQGDSDITYLTEPIDATNLPEKHKGIRTMICSMHHMKPDLAKSILKDAKDARQPICVFEISDNSFPPVWLWWLPIPINIITTLFITPMVRPMNWKQIVFTYLIPLLPIFIAWDGAVSNSRTYTLEDMDILLEGLHSEDYTWEKGVIKGKSKKLYLLGLPVKN